MYFTRMQMTKEQKKYQRKMLVKEQGGEDLGLLDEFKEIEKLVQSRDKNRQNAMVERQI